MAQQTAGAPRVAPVWARRPVPVGTIQAFDACPVNWLFITWSTLEEPVRLDNDGQIVLALAKPRAAWRTAPRDSTAPRLEAPDPLRVKRFSSRTDPGMWCGRGVYAAHGAQCQPPSEWR
jgi:hypothetical protein